MYSVSTVLIGLVRRGRFSYGRALLAPGLSYSFLLEEVAEDLMCREHIEDMRPVSIETREGLFRVFDVCIVDRAVVNGYTIDVPTVIHVAEQLSGQRLYEIYIGRDIVSRWGLYIDPSGQVKTRIGRRELVL